MFPFDGHVKTEPDANPNVTRFVARVHVVKNTTCIHVIRDSELRTETSLPFLSSSLIIPLVSS